MARPVRRRDLAMIAHRVTAERFRADPKDPRHGTQNGYVNLKCRCARCREAWRIYHHAWMHADPARLEAHADREWLRRHLPSR